jgi:small subunit ribosomal protein S4
VRRARRAKGPTGEVLLQMLEMRLDSIVFRLGFAPTIRAARQYVSHGLITINGARVNIPSYHCAAGETIASTSPPVVENCKTFGGTLPSHLTVDAKKTMGQVQRAITRSQIALTVNELLIIEFYSRKG